MKSYALGRSTFEAEVQDVSRLGVWIYVKGREYFLSYKDFPWFKNARVSEIYNVKMVHGNHLNWPDLDIDLALESLGHPEKYPLIYR